MAYGKKCGKAMCDGNTKFSPKKMNNMSNEMGKKPTKLLHTQKLAVESSASETNVCSVCALCVGSFYIDTYCAKHHESPNDSKCDADDIDPMLKR